MRRIQSNAFVSGQSNFTSSRIPRRGSALLIVIALMGILLLLGFVFYSYAAQERSNAEFFLESEMSADAPERDYFDWALEQLIVGPRSQMDPDRPYQRLPVQSALWGRRHSLLANAIGLNDTVPFNGEGINLIANPSNQLRWAVDFNYDGEPDFNNPGNLTQNPATGIDYLSTNDSPAAYGGEVNLRQMPAPDVDYTYPDINSMFLGYRSVAPTLQPGNSPPRLVIIPSFLRPQYMRDIPWNGVDLNNDGTNESFWYNYPGLGARSLRPHPEHMVFDGDGNVQNNKPRFLNDVQAQAKGLTAGFPFQPVDPATGQPTAARQGVWSDSNSSMPYEYDVDNDGDGIREGIWMDLDFPLQETPDGRRYVPMFSFTVLDADSLLNLNAHGNVPNLSVNLNGMNFGLSNFLSQSNQGLDPSEVNLQWGLKNQGRIDLNNPDTVTDLAKYRQYFGRLPVNLQELANMEWWSLAKGRPEYDATGLIGIHAGRYGEPGLVLTGMERTDSRYYPLPGISFRERVSFFGLDDNNNQFSGGTNDGIFSERFVHPLGWSGLGQFTTQANYANASLVQPIANNPSRWLQYRNYQVPGLDPADTSAQVARQGKPHWILSPYGNQLMTSVNFNALMNETSEMSFTEFNDARYQDDMFDVSEMAMLHLRKSDLEGEETASTRLADLAPYSFSTNRGLDQLTNVRHALPIDPNNPSLGTGDPRTLRERFTTLSWDRRDIGQSRSLEDQRKWEYLLGDEDLFPPLFGPVNNMNNPRSSKIPEYTNQVQGGQRIQDPFRAPVRQLMSQHRMKLSVNHLLVLADGRLNVGSAGGADRVLRKDPYFRKLTPHPAECIGELQGPYPYRSITDQSLTIDERQKAQEYWARRDRQALARDIFVLIYTFCGGDEIRDYTRVNNDPDGNSPMFTEEQLIAMGQFAVNVVDAMDDDEIMSRFEFDTNLVNGWNLDDNPATNENSSDRLVVSGIESQQLTLSELLAIYTEEVVDSGMPGSQPEDHPGTEYNDSQERYFAYMELRNATPFEIDFSSEAWQLRFQPVEDGTPVYRHLTLRAGAGKVSPGGLYSIASTDNNQLLDTEDNQQRPYSQLKIDPQWKPDDATTPDFGLPRSSIVPPLQQHPTAQLDLDLIRALDINANDPGYLLEDSDDLDLTAQPGSLLSDVTRPDQEVRVQLWRRSNPRHRAPQGVPKTSQRYKDFNRQNPWVLVDVMSTGEFKTLSLEPDTEDADLRQELAKLDSLERKEPLSRSDTTSYQANSPYSNTIGANNDYSGGQFNLWQAHFDREFASLAELLFVPVIGPEDLTRRLPNFKSTNSEYLAMGRIFNPQASSNNVNPPTPPGNPLPPGQNRRKFPGSEVEALDNLWYRLLGFLEVPTRVNRHLHANLVHMKREPGRINLNTLRHAEVLAGLLDEIDQIDFPDSNSDGVADNPLELRDKTENSRDWFRQLLRSRDGAQMLPGLPDSIPFRALNFSRRGVNSLEDTVLRSLPKDLNLMGRRLFEVGTKGQFDAGTIDPALRYQLISKMLENVTTRSNVFIVHVSVGFFEATEDQEGRVQIGGRFDIDTNDGEQPPAVDHRGFFVVDRSRLEESYDSTDGRFDWRTLVIQKHRIK